MKRFIVAVIYVLVTQSDGSIAYFSYEGQSPEVVKQLMDERKATYQIATETEEKAQVESLKTKSLGETQK